MRFKLLVGKHAGKDSQNKPRVWKAGEIIDTNQNLVQLFGAAKFQLISGEPSRAYPPGFKKPDVYQDPAQPHTPHSPRPRVRRDQDTQIPTPPDSVPQDEGGEVVDSPQQFDKGDRPGETGSQDFRKKELEEYRKDQEGAYDDDQPARPDPSLKDTGGHDLKQSDVQDAAQQADDRGHEVNLRSMSKDELKKMAEELELDTSKLKTKDQLIEAIEAV
jgi:hypothetical protein